MTTKKNNGEDNNYEGVSIVKVIGLALALFSWYFGFRFWHVFGQLTSIMLFLLGIFLFSISFILAQLTDHINALNKKVNQLDKKLGDS